MLLEVSNLTVCYDRAVLINDVSLRVDEGELVSLVGPNGAGKTTVLRAITGLVAWDKMTLRGTSQGDITIKGKVMFDGKDISKTPAHQIVKMGLVHCPERRRPFRELTVKENLMAGAFLHMKKADIQDELDKVFKLFPVLGDRLNQVSGTLSGGEQQMLAVGRALMSRPKLLLIDEPSTGLAPLMREEVFNKIAEIRSLGITIMLVEQEVASVFSMASRSYVLSTGKIIAQGACDALLEDEMIRKTYLGL
ncbi:ABC transporter ATP-binding protein [Desulfatibacillum aliphaticivorans]|uniref:ABC transporter ATP-binding protein n=1 Tax=Desulfatibacillum aliphaticivorans TaxID=218208 RepID=UPI0004008709|nr:ABC transporter ATP-binding protein [Desulfatibacillum aliphaticivorans]